MMGPTQVAQGALFYEFVIEDHVPPDHLLRGIDRFVDLGDMRRHLAPRPVAGAARSEAYLALMGKLVELRKSAGLSQVQLARKLGKPPSYVGKYELGGRRLDVVEIWILLHCLEADPCAVLEDIFRDTRTA